MGETTRYASVTTTEKANTALNEKHVTGTEGDPEAVALHHGHYVRMGDDGPAKAGHRTWVSTRPLEVEYGVSLGGGAGAVAPLMLPTMLGWIVQW